ncbi:MAG: T9SS C-terminal target domain-containing protein [Ignavibacteriae bacterium]|nr:MAG: T9SS C-terminal target domain-containing protein [Ignavibacteriota bacterium]
MGSRINIVRSPTGRFSIALNTKQYATPWYRLEFSRVTSGVVVDEDLVVNAEGSYSLTVADLTGNIVMSANGDGHVPVDVSSLAAGMYMVRIVSAGTARTEKIVKY